MPSCSNFDWATFPTPQIRPILFGAKNSSILSLPITENPRGLSRSEASLARYLLYERPIDAEIFSSDSIRCTNLAIDKAGGSPCNFSVPFKSIKASSKDNGSIDGESSFIILCISFDASA